MLDSGQVDLNVKRGPLLTGSFREEPGIYPAYHMNKAGRLSAAPDGGVSEETAKLLGMSYDLTAPKAKKARRKEDDVP